MAAVIDLLTYFGPEDLGGSVYVILSVVVIVLCVKLEELPESLDQRIDGKKFYFDVASNERGIYLRILLEVCLPVCLSVCLSVCLGVCLTV